tara:strand:- start:39538 stop:40512 length:975 start_codon:yes stop_codon:yes gene_type:complete
MDDSRPESLRKALDDWRVRLDDPWLVAVWPGMGSVARLVGAYLSQQLAVQHIADLADETYTPPAVQVQNGLIQPVPSPRQSLSGWRHPTGGRDLVIFESEAQPQQPGARVGLRLIEAARTLGVTRICTFAAMATLIDPGTAPRVFAAATDAVLLDEVLRLDAVPLVDGSIGGLNGSLAGMAAEHGIGALCLLGEMPYYATGFANPKAAAAALRVFAKQADITLDMSALDAQAATVERHLLELRKRADRGAIMLDAAATEEPQSTEPEATSQDPAEQRTKRRIERLFDVVRRDRSRAPLLKAELDRHGWFARYEDRFLDLFKRAD